METALTADEEFAIALNLQRSGKTAEAEALLGLILRAQPDHVAALHLAGICRHLQGDNENAVRLIGASLQRAPNVALAWNSLGSACRGLKRPEQALQGFDNAIALKPEFAAAHFNRGLVLAELERLEEALFSAERTVLIKPDHRDAHILRGDTLQKMRRFEEALASYDHAIALDPGCAPAYYNRGNVLQQLERFAAAEASHDQAIALQNDFVDAINNRGIARRMQLKHPEALADFERAVALDPRHESANLSRAVTLQELHRIDEALDSYNQAVAIAPDSAAIHCNQSLCRLLGADFEGGWTQYEWRWQAGERGPRRRPFAQPQWQGEALTGKSLLVWGEQGIGDELLFAGMYEEISRQAGRCVIECAGKLLPLFRRSFPDAEVVPLSNPPHAATLQGIDYQIPSGSLGRWLRPNLASFPDHPGYLIPDPERVADWRNRLAELGPGPKVGIGWRSSDIQGERAWACTRLTQWGPILGVAGVHFVNLQYDECTAELEDARERCGVAIHRYPEVDLYNDLDEAAALTKALDLVISAPTSVSLLSAALGVPTWQMAFGYDWQTMGTDHLPWFPALRRYPRQWNQDWETIIAKIAAGLAQTASDYWPV